LLVLGRHSVMLGSLVFIWDDPVILHMHLLICAIAYYCFVLTCLLSRDAVYSFRRCFI